MKKFKISVSLFALLLGAGLAIGNANFSIARSNRLTISWFTYNGSGSVTDPANYTEVSGEPDCPGTTSMCSIQATVGSGSKPVITTSLRNEINADLANHSPSTDVLLQDE